MTIIIEQKCPSVQKIYVILEDFYNHFISKQF